MLKSPWWYILCTQCQRLPVMHNHSWSCYWWCRISEPNITIRKRGFWQCSSTLFNVLYLILWWHDKTDHGCSVSPCSLQALYKLQVTDNVQLGLLRNPLEGPLDSLYITSSSTSHWYSVKLRLNQLQLLLSNYKIPREK